MGSSGHLQSEATTTDDLNVNAEDGKQKYDKRKTLKEKKREKKAISEAAGDIPPSRPTTEVDTASHASRVAPTSLAKTSKAPPKNEVSQVEEAHKKKGAPKPVTANAALNSNGMSLQASQPQEPKKAPITKLTPLQTAMQAKLQGARFRHLNQMLYTKPSTDSLKLFSENASFFTEYHEGFSRQVGLWPSNPVDGFVSQIKTRGAVLPPSIESQAARFRKEKNKPKKQKQGQTPHVSDLPAPIPLDQNGKPIEPLPRNPRTHISTIVDLGCGTASLASSLQPYLQKLKLNIQSFDLAAPSNNNINNRNLVTVADIRSLPCQAGSVNVAIFSLALMGTNWLEFIEEAWRVLSWKGECWIGEVGSRFVRTPAARAGGGGGGGGGGGRVDHSVGKKRAKKKNGGKATKGDDEQGEAGAEAEDGFNGIDTLEETTTTTTSSTTEKDLAPFLSVLRTRGFILVEPPELTNKMFLRLRFSKALTPTRGKCVPVQNDRGGEVWRQNKRVLDKGGEDSGEISVEEEGKVLKPCVYKTR